MTRERATVIGAQEIEERMIGYGAYPAVAYEELYQVPAVDGLDLTSCWFVYARKTMQGLGGSYVVVVTRDGRTVLCDT